MTVTTTEARKNLFSLIREVNEDFTEIEITSKHGSAVLVSKEMFDSLQETAYLLQSPKNAERLLEGLRQARSGEVETHQLFEV